MDRKKDTNMKPFEWKVQYYETDQMGIVHHSNYIRWFESARIDFLEQLGIPYHKMERCGIVSPVISVECKYRQMTRFGETVVITPLLKSYNSIRYVVSYEVRNKETGELNATGETAHCFLNKDGKLTALKKELPDMDAILGAQLSPSGDVPS